MELHHPPKCRLIHACSSWTSPWADRGNPCDGINPHNGLGKELTIGGQAAFIIKVEGPKDARIAFFDINQPEHPHESPYIWLPVSFDDGRMRIRWCNEWSIGDLATPAGKTN